MTSSAEREAIVARARQSIAAGSSDAEALAIAAWALVQLDHDSEAGYRAVRLNPLSRVAWNASAWIRTMTGEYEEPMRHWEAAERCNPFGLGLDQTLGGRALCCFLAGKLDAARTWAKACQDHAPSHPAGHAAALAAAVEAGDLEVASEAAAAFIRHVPDGLDSPVIRRLPLRRPNEKARLLDAVSRGLALAGP